MKKVLMLNQDPKFIAELQVKFSQRFEILATENYDTTLRLLKTLPIDLVLARLPPPNFNNQGISLKKLLKKLQKKRFASITRILTVPEGAECQVDEFLKLGIAAVVVDVDEVARWLE